MSNIQKYDQAFTGVLGVSQSDLPGLKYQSIPAWDSVGHMGLVAAVEDAFGIMMGTDDIIDFSSYEKGKELLGKYDVEL
jgi:hypothetical protein